MSVEIASLPPSPAADAEVEAFLEACPESFAQQTPAWRDAVCTVGVDEPAYIVCRVDGRIAGVLPAYRYVGPLGPILNSIPQAGPLGGVACDPAANRGVVYGALLDGFTARARELSCATASLMTNPLWPDRELCATCLAPDYELENACQVLDLHECLDAEGNLRTGSQNVRRNLAKAEDGALVVDEEQTPENVAAWYEIHDERHRSIGATPLPRALFDGALAHAVPADKARFYFVRTSNEGTMIAGGLYVRHGLVVDALMPSVATVHAKRGASYLLAIHTMRWAKSVGTRYYNWQASPPASGVYHYKKQWGSDDVPYSWMTKVTGDVRPFLESTPLEVGEAYAWHFALPFDRIGTTSGNGSSSRDTAWRARNEDGA